MKPIGGIHAQADDAASRDKAGFRLEEFLPYELAVTAGRTSRLFARRFEAAFGLSVAEWRVLAVVGRGDTVTPGAVAERADMDKVKVSRATAALVAMKLLEQTQAQHDGRVRLLSLTRKGTQVHDGIMPLALTLEAELAAGLSEHQWTELRDCLRRLKERVGVLEQAAPERGPHVLDD
jgi:DNA-binding MarR family transcriptional regulator